MSTHNALPHADGPEKSVLSSILQDPDEHLPIAQEAGLRPESFHIPAHATIFAAILDQSQKGHPIELVSFTQHLRAAGELETVGGPAGLTGLCTYAPTAAHFQHHLRLLLDHYRLRQLAILCTDTLAAIQDPSPDLPALLDGHAGALERIRTAAEACEATSTPIRATLREVMADIEDRLAGRHDPLLPTPWPSLEAGRGHLIIVAARPGGGKTAMALNWLEHIATQAGEPTTAISIEQPGRELGYRTLSSASSTPLADIGPDRQLTRGELQRLQGAVEKLENSPFHTHDLPGAHVGDVLRVIRADHRRLGVKIFALDYLQKLQPRPGQEAMTDKQRIDSALRDLDALRKKLGITLILLAQLDRKADGVPARRIPMAWLSDTSQTEKDADTVIVLGDYGGETPPTLPDAHRLLEAASPKQRHRGRSAFPIALAQETTTFYEP